MKAEMKVTLETIKRAEEVIRPFIYRTLLKKSNTISESVGFETYVKLDNMQKTGSFKIRGAANKFLNLTPEEKKKGVITSSAGNHAQAVACMAQKLNIKATIVMPENSPLIKVHSTRRFGVNVVMHGFNFDEAFQHALELQKKDGS